MFYGKITNNFDRYFDWVLICSQFIFVCVVLFFITQCHRKMNHCRKDYEKKLIAFHWYMQEWRNFFPIDWVFSYWTWKLCLAIQWPVTVFKSEVWGTPERNAIDLLIRCEKVIWEIIGSNKRVNLFAQPVEHINRCANDIFSN